jgi:branched-subunit amino acid ABC-type transport system permease component
VEGARAYQAAQHLVAKLAVPVWYLVATMRVALYALALIAFWAGPVLGEAALTLAVTSFGLALMVSPVLREWKRPREPVVVDVEDGAQVLAIRGVEHRLTVTLRLLVLASLVWTLASA